MAGDSASYRYRKDVERLEKKIFNKYSKHIVRGGRKMSRRIIIWIFLVSFVLWFFGVEKTFSQETFPSKPITLLSPWPPGGVSDTVARLTTTRASQSLGQQVVVVNKPGAGGTLAIDFLAGSKPDGYTVLSGGLGALAYSLYTHGVSWGPKDFSLILGYYIYNYSVVIRSDAPWKNFNEWVQYVKQNPGFKYGTYGNMTTHHVIMEWIAKRLDLKLVPVHFAGDTPGITSLLGGHIDAQCIAGGQISLFKAGKIRTLLQMFGEPVDIDPKIVTRFKDVLPDAPLEVLGIPAGVFGPKGIPDSIQARLHEAFKKGSVENPEFVQMLQSMNLTPEYHDPKELQKVLTKAYEDFGKLIKSLGLERK